MEDKPRTSLEINRTSLDIPRNFQELKQRHDVAIQKKKVMKKKKKKMSFSDLKKEIQIVEHAFTLEELTKHFAESGINVDQVELSSGLDSKTAKFRLKMNGPNKLKPPKQAPLIVKFLLQFSDFFSLLLLGGSGLCMIAFITDLINTIINNGPFIYDNLVLGTVLFVVTVITNIASFIQEYQSDKVMEGFRHLVPEKAQVIRDGKSISINAEDLVVGDIIEIKSGDKIPADIRVITSKDIKVDNSSLTGESEPQSRVPQCTNKEQPLESKNMCYFGTLVAGGKGYGVVVFTGESTVMGRIAGLASSVKQKATPLHIEIHRFIYIISAIAIFLGVTFLLINVIRDAFYGRFNLVNNVVFTIGIIVANVPEGLLATVTVALTLTAQRMAKKNVLVKHLESVETLGSTTTIASDKTGTLTQNRMTVAHLWFDDCIWNCPTNPSESGNYDEESPTFKDLQRIATLCNNAKFEQTPENLAKSIWIRKTIGDASESAFIKFCQPIRDIIEYRNANPEICGIPFNSKNKWQLSIHELEDPNDKRKVLVMKGGPEIILSHCQSIMVEGKPVKLNQEWIEKFRDANKTLGGFGERVLGFASCYIEEDEFPEDGKWVVENLNLPRKNLTFVGLMSMIDPPREGVVQAVHKCKTAGIRVIMVTGDMHITATAIAKQVGIITGKTRQDVADEMGVDVTKVSWDKCDAAVVQGKEISGLTKQDWDDIFKKREIVFARTTPQHKLIIVEHAQERGEIVAVTGDGVNDSPALKKANIGVAMGIGGTHVSKEAADMILMDDNFASIVNGVEEGRLIFDNLKKSIAYTLSSNIPEITPFLMFILFSIPLPLGTILILCVDLGTDLVPAISLAYEGSESDIMFRPPRDAKTDRLVTSRLISFSYFQIGVIQALAGFYCYFVVLGYYGFPVYMLPGLALNFFQLKDSPPIRNIHGEIFDQTQQLDILGEAQTAYLASIIIVQWADLIICKTRKLSLFQQGMKNGMLNFGLIFETCLILFLVYTPFTKYLLGTRQISRIEFWLGGLPFSLLIFAYDEIRKLILRKQGENGWFKRMTYW